MRAKDIVKGGEYWTKVGDQRVKVRVVMVRKGGAGIGRMGKYQVERVDNNQLLPKWRSPQALHPVGEGPWPGAMQRQEYPSQEKYSVTRSYKNHRLGEEVIVRSGGRFIGRFYTGTGSAFDRDGNILSGYSDEKGAIRAIIDSAEV